MLIAMLRAVPVSPKPCALTRSDCCSSLPPIEDLLNGTWRTGLECHRAAVGIFMKQNRYFGDIRKII